MKMEVKKFLGISDAPIKSLRKRFVVLALGSPFIGCAIGIIYAVILGYIYDVSAEAAGWGLPYAMAGYKGAVVGIILSIVFGFFALEFLSAKNNARVWGRFNCGFYAGSVVNFVGCKISNYDNSIGNTDDRWCLYDN